MLQYSLNLQVGFANDLQPWVVQWWSRKVLEVLRERAVILNLLEKNWDNELVSEGDTIKVHRTNKFTAPVLLMVIRS
jgi:hypothetical protein